MGLKDAKREKPAQEEAIRDTASKEKQIRFRFGAMAGCKASWQRGAFVNLPVGIAGGNADAAVYQTVLPSY